MSSEKKDSSSQARSTGIVSIAILCSRVLGLVRDQVLTGMFGSFFNGLFTAAFRTPNMLRDLFAEGALSTAFVTTFSKKIKNEGDEAAWQLGRKMLALSLCFMSMVAVAGVALAPYLVRLLNIGWVLKKVENPVSALPDGWTLERATELTVELAQIMYPFITIVSITALVMGMLNSKKVFFIPAVASAFFNLGCIVGGLIMAWIIDPAFRNGGVVTDRGLAGFAVGTLIGGVLQLAVQIPSLRRVGFRFGLDFKWNDPGVKEVLHLMWPSLIAASGTQVSVLLNSIFASCVAGQGSNLTWLSIAQRLQQLPLGLFGVAVATVTLPMLSRLATEGVTPAFRQTLAKGLRLVLFLTLPSAVGMALLAPEIVSVIFERGKFTSFDVAQSVGPLRAAAFGLVFYACIKVVQPAFYTIGRRFVPMLASIGVILFTATANSITVFVLEWGHAAIAWATAFGLLLNFLTLYVCMRKFAHGLETGSLLAGLVRLIIAVAAMAGVCLTAKYTILSGWSHLRLLGRCGVLGLTIAAAAAAYFAVTRKLRVEESGEFLSLLGRRFGKR
ncbi:murein biosynthesis integral membrane protein MurJ [Prosthecobacter sp.]|uniref:murein biosynthesis integral membrane protein MurJ n=1 Tax=Prosthecobacter sp. TaxID=1965333 RepID=UPI003784EF9E